MAVPAEFNAAQWFSDNTAGGSRLTLETQHSIADFTTMWNFFEGNLCRNEGNVPAFESVADRYRPSAEQHQKVCGCLAFWRSRYTSEEGILPRFDRLEFRARDRRPMVESVLLGQNDEPRDVLLAMLIIIYRLRNNLFHGLKSLEILNDQVENLRTATYCLSIVLSATPSPLVRPQYA
ncbi:hypothetical protein KDL21_01925 [Pseudomonas syringae pv. syringae]|uniref:hypothetical protein n=1 Tax=Pseudomonas syringae TaxID=317 RepID=UPI0018E64F6E|nr:hypothetical protein [Pseudomonas syringae]MBI6799079.1 hypothetical protein [Pseudomonas syringae]MDC3739781.1 hypothetical protein [Pseudomonas syringae pv. syringae]